MSQRNRGRREDGHRRRNSRSTDRETSEFLLRACHDLRTSLRSVRAHAELLLQRGETARTSDFKQRLGFIVDGARRIDLLLDGLGNYSVALQTEAGSFQLMPMDVILRTALARLDKELRDNDAKVTYGKLPRVRGNPDRIVQILENLIRNAICHRGEASPLIHISAEKKVDSWLFSVRDNGPGVEAACQESIFKPFERAHRNEYIGPGLGLAICREIVERHGGRIWVESKKGSGATFLFTLPAD